MSEDIINRIFELVYQAQPSFRKEDEIKIQQTVRHELSGVRLKKRDENIHLVIKERFTGNNTAKLARELRVSRRTIQRIVRASRRKLEK